MRHSDRGSFHEGSDNLPPEFWTFDDVEERMIEAVGFLDRVSGGGASPFAKDGPWDQIRPEWGDYIDRDARREMLARERGGLNVDQVGRMDEALEWIMFVPHRGGHRRLVGAVLLFLHNGGSRVEWGEIKRRLGSKDSREALRKGYGRSITRIAECLNAGKSARLSVKPVNRHG